MSQGNTSPNNNEFEKHLFKIQYDIAELKSTLIPSEILLNEIENVKKSQEDTKQDLREIKKLLLDPNDGVIVRVNKNTEHREEHEEAEREYDKLRREHYELVNWKSNVVKFLWIVVTSVTASLVYVFNKISN
jgi:hypothetical protein